MNKNRRLKAAKRTIFLGWIAAIIGATSFLLYRLDLVESTNPQIPIWILPFFVIGSLLMLAGVLLGSRGIGVPLDTEKFLSLSFGYPCWLAAAIYLGIMIFAKFL